jgi:hypothetical protein
VSSWPRVSQTSFQGQPDRLSFLPEARTAIEFGQGHMSMADWPLRRITDVEFRAKKIREKGVET